ncbi:gamma-glutamyl-gamma-aminobutyrate hydrolase family protein [Fusibacter bizertensis]|uniref:Gamma-glutamyl-gamma-aminobutyrate hydrolase family protein n=1 Tax=Fusibacter bizertensis TaxID=1488331 RepID=A0ABT6NDT0_9FIRM|nr:gamma-glutamyl-gamma-aminobutyrate hydrolase family protein [Fusibacter bizertensis]MDH8678592.1 gamma-glutamyl-gamma-aminobutyrate hydrolase family protein [Fusibacter bizertensis]
MTKFVAITMRVDDVLSYRERRDAIDQNWYDFITECGYTPILLPNKLTVVKELLSSIQLSGIILSGGNSLVKYDGDAPERDEIERYCIKFAETVKVPLIGVCRGMQVIADYYENNLVNIPNHVAVKHQIVDANNIERTVNSYHNMGIESIKSPLRINAQSKDGSIESISHTIFQIIGIMWHPERETPFELEDINLFSNFFKNK